MFCPIWAAGNGGRDERRWDEFGLRPAHSYITSTCDGLNLCGGCWIILSGPFCQSQRPMTALSHHPSVCPCPCLWPPCPCLNNMNWLSPDEVCPAVMLFSLYILDTPKNRSETSHIMLQSSWSFCLLSLDQLKKKNEYNEILRLHGYIRCSMKALLAAAFMGV